MSNLVAVDIGATNIRVASGDPKGIHRVIKERTNLENSKSIPNQIIDMIRELDVTPTSIGIGSIGPIDNKEGTIINSPNIPHKRVPIVELLVAEFNAPTRIMNDCATGVIGEWKHGGGKGHNNLVYITLSTGLGGGAIVDGNLLSGKDGNAVEVGHITIDPESPLICGCGC